MKELNKIHTKKPTLTHEDFKRKRHTLLSSIGGEWYVDQISNPKAPKNKPWLIKNNKN